MSDLMPLPTGRAQAPDEVWERVRADYLSGVSGRDCCRRHGVGITALRERAAKEGWRRADLPWTPLNRLDPDDEGVQLEVRVEGDLDRVGFTELSFVAERRMMRAVMRGEAAEALRWRRVRQALDEDEAEFQRSIDQEMLMRARLGLDADPDSSDSSDSVLEPLQAPPADPA